MTVDRLSAFASPSVPATRSPLLFCGSDVLTCLIHVIFFRSLNSLCSDFTLMDPEYLLAYFGI
jgi:hypothetical protein